MSALLLPIYILIFIGLIYLVGVRPQQKRRKQLEEILGSLRPGDEVVTVSGRSRPALTSDPTPRQGARRSPRTVGRYSDTVG